jgi:uncharacterized phage protein (TIGR02218 family)
MTFEAFETSAYGGRPVEIYTFRRDYQAWRYTSADRDVVVDNQTFTAHSISRTEIEDSHEKARASLTLTVPADLEVADLYRVAPPAMTITLTLQAYHVGDAELAVLWTGRILGVEWAGNAAKITLEPVSTSMRRIGLRRLFQRQCPHVLYGSACGVDRTAYRIEGVIDTVGGASITVPEADLLPDGYLAGGYVEWDIATGIADRRMIESHAAGVLGLVGPTYGMAGGQAVRLYPGCDHILTTCQDKFGNAINFGGFPWFPGNNPFSGDPVY